MSWHWLIPAVAASLVAGPSAGAPGRAPFQQTSRSRSAWDGVFTAAQARRGQQKYETHCAFCHALAPLPPDAHVDGWTGGPIGGERFLKRFDTAFKLLQIVSTTMPEGDPGGLGHQSYLDLVAFILAANHFPAGDQELPRDADSLTQIHIESARR